MSRTAWIVIGIIAAIIFIAHLQPVKAEPLQYYGTPVFYGKFMPDTVDCIYNEKHRYGYCGVEPPVEEGEVGYTVPGQPGKGIGQVIRLYGEVVCTDFHCASNYGEPLGIVEAKGTSYWYVPTGFYISNHTGVYKAYKHGTGPYAHDFPKKNIKVIPELNDLPRGIIQEYKDTLERYDVYCNDGGDCSYLNRVMTIEQLAEYVPKVMTTRCGPTFCYHPDDTIAGLNPRSN